MNLFLVLYNTFQHCGIIERGNRKEIVSTKNALISLWKVSSSDDFEFEAFRAETCYEKWGEESKEGQEFFTSELRMTKHKEQPQVKE